MTAYTTKFISPMNKEQFLVIHSVGYDSILKSDRFRDANKRAFLNQKQ